MNENVSRNQNKKMTSIARKINMSFWLRRLVAAIFMDLLIVVLIVIFYLLWCQNKLPSKHAINIYYERIHAYEGTYNYEFELQDENGEWYGFDIGEVAEYIVYPFGIVLAVQGIGLFFSLFRTGTVRRKLKPLNDLAIKAEQISAIPLDTSSLEHLEYAISNISPDVAELGIHTGDKELQSIEAALNNLLHRMKESERQQTRFVSDASHELRTPIAVIQGYVNMLDRWGKEDESVLDESIWALKSEAEHMKILVEQLLFLARGDSGRNTLNKTEFDLTEVVREVFEESVMIDTEHNYVFKQAKNDENEELPQIMINADFAMVKQSIRIFVQNAQKYSNKGDTITFSVNKEGDSASYSIQDEGVGMQENDVMHIFERFYRSDEARNKSTGGSGLGLSIAKWIVDAHGGNINVLSRADFGTRFTVTF